MKIYKINNIIIIFNIEHQFKINNFTNYKNLIKPITNLIIIYKCNVILNLLFYIYIYILIYICIFFKKKNILLKF